MRLLAILELLEQAKLILRGEEGGYLFAHSLIQEAAYSALLRRERRLIHRATGEAIEKEHAASLSEIAPILASHFEEAGDDERALRYRMMAGDAALRVYALPEAIDHFSRGLEIAHRLPAAVSTEELLHLYSSRGRAFELASRHSEALANYEEMEAAPAGAEEPRLKLAGRMARASILAGSSSRRDADLAENLSHEALDLARTLDDSAAEAKVQWILSNLHGFSGRQPEAVTHGEKSLAIARGHGLREQEAFTLTDISRVYGSLGRYPEAWSALAQAQALWRKQGNLPMLADTLASSVLSDYLRGELARAVASAEEAQRISHEIGNLWGQAYSRMFVGSAHRERGEIGLALKSWKECLELCEPAGFPGPLIYTRTDIALLHADVGMVRESEALLEEAMEAAEKHFPKYRPVPLLARARLDGLRGNHDVAARALREVASVLAESDPAVGLLTSRLPVVAAELALLRGDFGGAVRAAAGDERLRALGIRAPLPYLHYYRGQAYLELGELEKARAAFDEAREESEAMGSRWVLWRVLRGLSEAAARSGEMAEAEDWRRKGYADVVEVANTMGDRALSEAFFSLAEVRTLLPGS